MWVKFVREYLGYGAVGLVCYSRGLEGSQVEKPYLTVLATGSELILF